MEMKRKIVVEVWRNKKHNLLQEVINLNYFISFCLSCFFKIIQGVGKILEKYKHNNELKIRKRLIFINNFLIIQTPWFLFSNQTILDN